jgi:AcrR family transcriptional regulator
MSVPDRSIDPKLLEAAKNEFMEKGFEMSSLASICAGAGVTTGALYKRYSGKEDLFATIVSDTIKDLEEVFQQKKIDLSKATDQQIFDAWTMSEEENLQWMKFLYERREGFTLLVRRAGGTRYGNFTHDWAERMNRVDYEYYLEARRRDMTSADITQEEMHALTSAFWALYYEPFIHGFTWEQMEKHVRTMCGFVDWHRALGIEPPQ